jgi:hypothetical protein
MIDLEQYRHRLNKAIAKEYKQWGFPTFTGKGKENYVYNSILLLVLSRK